MSDTRSAGIRAILLDIEGTTTPIAFVTRVLFPYARKRLRAHLDAHAGSPEYQALLTGLAEERLLSMRGGDTVPPWADAPPAARLASAAAFVEWLMDRDRKSTWLKELQGRIWEAGYERGEISGDVFSDVRPALQSWQTQGIEVGIFSSGSVLAQQLLFRHSSAGDLTRYVRWYFDTHMGAKGDPGSYRRIAATIGTSVDTVMFLSDVPRELDAASTAGMQVRLVVRPGNAPVRRNSAYQAIRSLDEIAFS